LHALRGQPMPWQVDLLHVASQLTPDGASLAYPYVVAVVPRRAGKSAATLAAFVQRLAVAPRVRCHYTAQTRADAALTFRDDWSPILRSTPLYGPRIGLRASNGSESVTWKHVPNSTRVTSTLSLFAPGPTALHGTDADAVGVDEAWSLTADKGGELEAGIQPAQSTRPHRQLWIISAGGTEDSTWLDRWVSLGRDGTPGVALVEYAADPDTDDLDDPAVWARVHPAVGHTISVDTLASIRATMDPAEFHRAFLGVWTHRSGQAPRLPVAAWTASLDPDAAPGGRSLAYGVETAHDGTHTALVAASLDADGRVVVEVIEHAPGTAWVPDVWRRVRARHRGTLYADQLGPTAPVVDALVRAGLPVTLLTTTQYAAACAALLDDVTGDRLRHRGQPVLDAAARTATARPVGDRWVWERRGRDVAALVAATVAAHGARHPVQVPTVHAVAG
jgi:hypothetical protein